MAEAIMILRVNGAMKLSEYENYLLVPVNRALAEPLIKEQESAKYPYTCEIKQHRPKRSLNANNYMWALLTEIAEVLSKEYPRAPEEIYFEMLKKYGVRTTISIIADGTEIFEQSYPYTERFGDSTLNGKQFFHYHIWKGSSQYDTKEMSRLIDGVVSEAQELKIETATPEELSRLKGEWRAG
jgi:hypothetical protein